MTIPLINIPFRKHGVMRLLSLALLSVVLVCAGGCRASKGAAERDRLHDQISHSKLDRTQKLIAEEAVSWMGTPYKYGGSEKGKGTDCSGMVLKVYEKVLDKKLPRNSAKQAEFCRKIRKRDVKVGDLVFFATGKDADRVSHVGIMIDDRNFIHASTRKGVIVSDVTTPYYERTFIMYGRVE